MRKYRWKSEETKESGIIHESIRVGKILVKIGFKVCVSLASLIIATKRMIFNQDVWHSPHLAFDKQTEIKGEKRIIVDTRSGILNVNEA